MAESGCLICLTNVGMAGSSLQCLIVILEYCSYHVVPLLHVKFRCYQSSSCFLQLDVDCWDVWHASLPEHQLPPICKVTFGCVEQVLEFFELSSDLLGIYCPWCFIWTHACESLYHVKDLPWFFAIIHPHHPVIDQAARHNSAGAELSHHIFDLVLALLNTLQDDVVDCSLVCLTDQFIYKEARLLLHHPLQHMS